MLDAIADFWKPIKKGQAEKLQPERLQIGSSLGFGFVPQAMLSGRRLFVSGINTYQFGEEALTSFVLTHEQDAGASAPSVSMIVAESDGEHYLAISRRISLNDRGKMFDADSFEGVLTKPEIVRVVCRDTISDFKGWVVNSYKREIQGLKGRIFKGDFRNLPLPPSTGAQEFEYTLLVSDSNEHAIEIEKYTDGRVEVYATIYRRVSDIGEITYPMMAAESARPEVKMASPPEKAPSPASIKVPEKSPSLGTSQPVAAKPAPAPVISAPAKPVEAVKPEAPKPVPTPVPNVVEAPKAAAPAEVAKPAPIALQEFTPAPPPKLEPTATQPKPVAPKPAEPIKESSINGTRPTMNTTDLSKPKVFIQNTAPENTLKQEIKAVSKNIEPFDNESIECDLRVANKIIDEAIRNEMRLTDIVRRIIELPVAYPEAVQIPVTLTDEDYALLAIRYGIPSSDRNGIKRRILEDLNDFSGKRGQAKAA